MFTSSIKSEIGNFQVVVVQRRQRNVQKKQRDARAKLLFCQSKPTAFLPLLLTSPLSLLKLCANGRKIVSQQLPTLLDVTCCVRLYILLRVVGSCCAKFETSQTQQCWELLRSFASSLTHLLTVRFQENMSSIMGWISK